MNKRIISCIVLTLFIAAYSSCDKQTTTTVPTENGGNAPVNPAQQKLLDLVNDVRAKGCNCGNTYFSPVGAVIWNSQLETAARKHSEYMNAIGDFSHTGENGSDAGDRIKAEGYDWMAYGENIAEGYETEEAVIETWLKSKGHCENIMDKDFKEMGIGTSGKYWTQDFGARQ